MRVRLRPRVRGAARDAARAADVDVATLRSDDRVEALAREQPQGVVTAIEPLLTEDRKERIERVLDTRTEAIVLVLESLEDPHNVAAILRTAEAFGVLEVHAIDPTRSLRLSRRVCQGCHKWLDVVVHPRVAPCVEQLRSRGYEVVGTSQTAPQGVEDLGVDGPVAICFGNEHAGLSDELRGLCSAMVGVRLCGFTQSLNVSVAAALVVQGLVRRIPPRLDEARRALLRARYYALAARSAREVLERRMEPVA